jgi:hypothetical protein
MQSRLVRILAALPAGFAAAESPDNSTPTYL